MKKQNTLLVFAAGTLLGIALAFCLGAAEKNAAPAKKEWSHVQVVTYASGLTGFFDTSTGKLYLYDADLRNCYQTRQLNELGAPLIRQ